jgi:hypothetical protein
MSGLLRQTPFHNELKMTEELDVRYSVGAARDWSRVEKRVVTSALMACLLEPEKTKRRRRIQLTLLAADLPMLEGEARQAERARLIFEQIERDAQKSASALASHANAGSYKRRLMFDLSEEQLKEKRSNEFRHLMGAGLTVHAMFDASKNNQEIGTLGARERVIDTYKSNPLFATNDKDLRVAWTNGRKVASLAAALLQFISDERLTKIRTGQHWMWRAGIERFLAYARYFEQFLLREKTNAKLRCNFVDLIRVPASWGIEPIEPEGALWLPETITKWSTVIVEPNS